MKKLLILAAFFAVFTSASHAQIYDFNDGKWGDAVIERPESGSFANATVNGITFVSASLYQKDGKGAKRFILDKKSTHSSITFPILNPSKNMIIEASVGTEERTMLVEEEIAGKWMTIEQPVVLTKQKATYALPISAKATKVRISNPSSSAIYIFKVTIE